MIKIQIHDDPSGTSTWKPPNCSVCGKLVGGIYFIKESGVLCRMCEEKSQKRKRKKKTQKK